jgi:glycolate oxidase iron-sulfur subunit
MRAVQDGRLALGGTAVTHIDRCLGCRACEAVCPSGVQYGNLLEHTRDHIEKRITRSPFQQFLRQVAIEKIFPSRRLMQLALLPARFTKWTGLERILPKSAREALSLIPDDMQAGDLRSFLLPPANTRAVWVSSQLRHGCDVRSTNLNSVRVLNAAGYDVVMPRRSRLLWRAARA